MNAAGRDALLFLLGEDAFALPLSAVDEVVRATWPMAVARAPFGCLGLVDLRGELMPLMDLAALLALRRPLRVETAADALVNRQLVIARHEGPPASHAALLVDAVLDVGHEEIASGAPATAPAAASQLGALVAGAAVSGGRRAVLLSAEKLLGGARGRLLRRATTSAPAVLKPSAALDHGAGR